MQVNEGGDKKILTWGQFRSKKEKKNLNIKMKFPINNINDSQKMLAQLVNEGEPGGTWVRYNISPDKIGFYKNQEAATMEIGYVVGNVLNLWGFHQWIYTQHNKMTPAQALQLEYLHSRLTRMINITIYLHILKDIIVKNQLLADDAAGIYSIVKKFPEIQNVITTLLLPMDSNLLKEFSIIRFIKETSHQQRKNMNKPFVKFIEETKGNASKEEKEAQILKYEVCAQEEKLWSLNIPEFMDKFLENLVTNSTGTNNSIKTLKTIREQVQTQIKKMDQIDIQDFKKKKIQEIQNAVVNNSPQGQGGLLYDDNNSVQSNQKQSISHMETIIVEKELKIIDLLKENWQIKEELSQTQSITQDPGKWEQIIVFSKEKISSLENENRMLRENKLTLETHIAKLREEGQNFWHNVEEEVQMRTKKLDDAARENVSLNAIITEKMEVIRRMEETIQIMNKKDPKDFENLKDLGTKLEKDDKIAKMQKEIENYKLDFNIKEQCIKELQDTKHTLETELDEAVKENRDLKVGLYKPLPKTGNIKEEIKEALEEQYNFIVLQLESGRYGDNKLRDLYRRSYAFHEREIKERIGKEFWKNIPSLFDNMPQMEPINLQERIPREHRMIIEDVRNNNPIGPEQIEKARIPVTTTIQQKEENINRFQKLIKKQEWKGNVEENQTEQKDQITIQEEEESPLRENLLSFRKVNQNPPNKGIMKLTVVNITTKRIFHLRDSHKTGISLTEDEQGNKFLIENTKGQKRNGRKIITSNLRIGQTITFKPESKRFIAMATLNDRGVRNEVPIHKGSIRISRDEIKRLQDIPAFENSQVCEIEITTVEDPIEIPTKMINNKGAKNITQEELKTQFIEITLANQEAPEQDRVKQASGQLNPRLEAGTFNLHKGYINQDELTHTWIYIPINILGWMVTENTRKIFVKGLKWMKTAKNLDYLNGREATFNISPWIKEEMAHPKKEKKNQKTSKEEKPNKEKPTSSTVIPPKKGKGKELAITNNVFKKWDKKNDAENKVINLIMDLGRKMEKIQSRNNSKESYRSTKGKNGKGKAKTE